MDTTGTPAIEAAAHQAYGEALYRARHIGEAVIAFERAAALGGDCDVLAERLWMCAMLQGDFERAWRISDAVMRRRGSRRPTDLPRHLRWVWDGTPLDGRRLLVRCNHGLGDTLQFIRFVPELAQMAGGITVEAQPALLPLLASVSGIDTLVPLDAETPPWDIEIELMEVPHALRVTLDALPAKVPYLGPPSGAHRRRGAGEELKVGIVWAAGAWRPERSVPSLLIERLAGIPGVKLVSLQHGPAVDEIEQPRLRTRIATPLAGSGDVMDTAALIGGMDVVLTVDTMVAHLAGALGVPVWLLLNAEADWRWMLGRSDSPWYPTMRLFRQVAPGAWDEVLQKVGEALASARSELCSWHQGGSPGRGPVASWGSAS